MQYARRRIVVALFEVLLEFCRTLSRIVDKGVGDSGEQGGISTQSRQRGRKVLFGGRGGLACVGRRVHFAQERRDQYFPVDRFAQMRIHARV